MPKRDKSEKHVTRKERTRLTASSTSRGRRPATVADAELAWPSDDDDDEQLLQTTARKDAVLRFLRPLCDVCCGLLAVLVVLAIAGSIVVSASLLHFRYFPSTIALNCCCAAPSVQPNPANTSSCTASMSSSPASRG